MEEFTSRFLFFLALSVMRFRDATVFGLTLRGTLPGIGSKTGLYMQMNTIKEYTLYSI